MLDAVGFWSYARDDDHNSDGRLSQLRIIIGKKIALHLGEKTTLWQDFEAIETGADWAKTIQNAISYANFFIPIVTPRFLKSRYCCEELMAFQKRMIDLGRDDLIFPIHYVNVDNHQPAESLFRESLALLRRHQGIDFIHLSEYDPNTSENVRILVSKLAKSIANALHKKLDPQKNFKKEMELLADLSSASLLLLPLSPVAETDAARAQDIYRQIASDAAAQKEERQKILQDLRDKIFAPQKTSSEVTNFKDPKKALDSFYSYIREK